MAEGKDKKMTEYIEREKVLKTLEKIKTEKEKELEKRIILIDGVTTVFNELRAIKSVIRIVKKDVPVADVQPVIHAKWIEDYIMTKFYICSNCKNYKYKRYNYCPDCGAKMDGDNHVKEN